MFQNHKTGSNKWFNIITVCAMQLARKMKKYSAFIFLILIILGIWQLSKYLGVDYKVRNIDDYENDNDYIQRDNRGPIQAHERDANHGKEMVIQNGPLEDLKNRVGLSTNNTEFLLDKKPFRILSGEIHYFRFPHQYWEARLLALKAVGLNSVTTYIPWNSHEPQKGRFDFTAMLDLPRFVRLAQSLDLYVILRIGPYICAEWEYGGLPSWLLKGDSKVRTSDPVFMNHVRDWFDKLIPLIKPLQYTNGGPVIAVQVENEYSAFPNPDPFYIKELKDMVQQRGIDEFLFVCDDRNGILGNDKRINYVGMLKSINVQNSPEIAIRELQKRQPNLPMFVSEYWTGWFDWWGGPHHNLGVPWLNNFDVPKFTKTTQELLKTAASMNLYVFAGGTNFGFMNGAFIEEEFRQTGDRTSPDITSYDYSAPVSEEGRLTEKYFELRSILQHLNPKAALPNPPIQPLLANYGSIQIKGYIPLGQLLAAFKSWMIKSINPISMESFPGNGDRKEGQSYGYALYECTLEGEDHFKLDFSNSIKDRALVFLDIVYQDTVVQRTKTLSIRGTSNTKHTLSFLVENQGRVNWVSKSQPGIMESQHKGIVGDIICNDNKLLHWRIWPLEFDSQFLRKLSEHLSHGTLEWKKLETEQAVPTPALVKATLELESKQPRDTFIELPEFEKGIVLVNGVNLGRYWNSAGPQKRLYLPGVWLHPGTNEVLIFEERVAGGLVSFHQYNKWT